MGTVVPNLASIRSESEEDNHSTHYEFNRKWEAAYWAAIRFAYDTHKRGVGAVGANRLAFQEFSDEVKSITCHERY